MSESPSPIRSHAGLAPLVTVLKESCCDQGYGIDMLPISVAQLQCFDQWLAEVTQPQRAVQLLEAMLHQGLLPDGITYSALVSACEKGALQQRALEAV